MVKESRTKTTDGCINLDGDWVCMSKCWSELVDVTASLTLSTADWCSGPCWNSLLFFVRSQRLADREARLGTKQLRNCR